MNLFNGNKSTFMTKNSFSFLQTLHFLFISNASPHFLHESILIDLITSIYYIILGKLPSLLVLPIIYSTLQSTMIYHNHDNTTRSEKQYLEQNGSRSIQKGRKIRSYLYGSWSPDGYWNRRVLGCRSLISSTYFFI